MAIPVPQKLTRNTPQTLWFGLYVIWGLDALLLIASIAGALVHRGAMQTIGKDAAPSIIAAQQIKTSLADMDADIANLMLGTKSAADDYELQRTKASRALIEAAKNITYGTAEQMPIEAIQVGMGTYEAKVQQARDLYDRGDAGFVAAYRSAADVMDNDLLPQADKLDEANNTELQRTYSDQSGKSIASMVLMLLTGAALIVALLAMQNYLNSKMRRILNPLLMLSTLVALGFILYTLGALASERRDLKVAKEDAFESIHALWYAKALGYSANTDESRYLLDTRHAQEHEQRFKQKSDTLKTRYLAKELDNITFEGEKDAATDAVRFFGTYLGVDSRIRDLETHGKHAEAIALCIGNNPDQSNWAFDQFDRAVDKTLRINQDAFDAAVQDGLSTLSHFEIKAAAVAVIIALLAFFGLFKRIEEYR